MPAPRKPPFEVVVAEHGTTVLRVCRAALRGQHAEAVDDAWSETFLSALTAWPSLPADANVQAWLVTIARRKGIDVVRAAGRRPTPVGDGVGPESRWASTDDAGSAAHADELDLAAAVGALPRRQREAVTFHYLAGLPYADVAELVGGRPDAVRRAAADGLASLRRSHPELDPRLEEPTP